VGEEQAEQIRAAIVEADHAGQGADSCPDLLLNYFRGQAIRTILAPVREDRAPARHRRRGENHVLEDLGEQARVYTDSAKTAFEPNFQHIFTLAGEVQRRR
jgi:hypothetical protein